jgi:hypothetical protein
LGFLDGKLSRCNVIMHLLINIECSLVTMENARNNMLCPCSDPSILAGCLQWRR